jgi:hypothetical protein
LPYVSAWTSVTGNNTFYTFGHSFGAMPSRCNAYWSPNANGSPKRPLGDFQNNCHVSGSYYWRGVDMVMDANTVSFYAYNGGYLFCYYDGTWRAQNSAYVQVICNR